MVKLLLTSTSNIINVTDNDGETPLRLAIRLRRPGFIEIVIKVLLNYSAKTTNVSVDDWRKVCGDNTSDIIKLSQGKEGSIELIPKDEPIESISFLARNQNRRYLLYGILIHLTRAKADNIL